MKMNLWKFELFLNPLYAGVVPVDVSDAILLYGVHKLSNFANLFEL